MAKKSVCIPQDCVLCMACANVCPRNAIHLVTDECGYEQIRIDEKKCIDCNLCSNVCNKRKTVDSYSPRACFAAQAIDKEKLGNSASGGAFQMLAECVLSQRGVCYGCTGEMVCGEFYARHIRIDSLESLPLILNSKYVPSSIGDIFSDVKNDLLEGKLVLFSGTPCQVQGLKAFLNCDYEKLLTVDLICHGVTSAQIFNDYIDELERQNDITITRYLFRDKSISWGTNFCYYYYNNSDKAQKKRVKHCSREESSYMIHYLKGNIFRESCYSCRLSNTQRVSDFTFGDYWEIESEHPEFVTKKRPKISLRQGVSCIMVNTTKAENLLPELRKKMIMHEVTLESIVAHNNNLQRASKRGNGRELLMHLYREKGYGAIEKLYRDTVGRKMYIYKIKNTIKSFLPDRIRILIYRTAVLRKVFFH